MKREGKDHPKLKLLARDLKIPLCYARGILESIWLEAATSWPRGDIGRASNEEIAISIDYPGDPDELINCLVRRRLFDEVPAASGRLYVHGWHIHSDRDVHIKLAKRCELFANGMPPGIPHDAFNYHIRLRILAEYNKKYPGLIPNESQEDAGQVPDKSQTSPRQVPHLSPPMPEPEPEPEPEPGTENIIAPHVGANLKPDAKKPKTWIEKVGAWFDAISDDAVAKYQARFPRLDVGTEIQKARVYAEARPNKYKNFEQFLGNWLINGQNMLEARERSRATGSNKPLARARDEADGLIKSNSPAHDPPEPDIPKPSTEAAKGFLRWREVRDVLAQKLASESFTAWIEPLTCSGLGREGVWLTCPSRFFRNWVANTFYEDIADSVCAVLGYEAPIFLIDTPPD